MNEFNDREIQVNERANEGKDRKKKNSFLKDLLKDIVIAAVIVLAITMVIKPTIVNQTSMLNTLKEGNYLLVNKLAYINKEHPERGDIVVFQSDLVNPDTGKEMLLIKRVIGVEGDVINFKDGQVILNGEILYEPYIFNEPSEYRCYPDESITYTLGENEVFVMGDHRSVSNDSRNYDLGPVMEDDVIGKAFIRLYPFNEIGLI